MSPPILAINSADDLISPPELGILEDKIKHVPKGRVIVLPLSPEIRGHGMHTVAEVWKQYLEDFAGSLLSKLPTAGRDEPVSLHTLLATLPSSVLVAQPDIGEFFDRFAAEWVRAHLHLATDSQYFSGHEQAKSRKVFRSSGRWWFS